MIKQSSKSDFGWTGLVLLLLTGLQWPEAGNAQGLAPQPEAEPVAAAAEYMDVATLHNRAIEFLNSQTSDWNSENIRYVVKVDPLDPRLKLFNCGEALTLSAPPQGIAPGRVSVRASCAGDKPWNIYMTGRIQALREVIVSARPMGRGEIIHAADLMLVEQELDALRRGYFVEPADVIGKVVKRPIPGNRVVETRSVAMPRLIRRGEMVRIIAEVGTVRVQMEGIALSDGAEGDRIQVRNRQSGRVVSAVVDQEGQVNVLL